MEFNFSIKCKCQFKTYCHHILIYKILKLHLINYFGCMMLQQSAKPVSLCMRERIHYKSEVNICQVIKDECDRQCYDRYPEFLNYFSRPFGQKEATQPDQIYMLYTEQDRFRCGRITTQTAFSVFIILEIKFTVLVAINLYSR